ncbi:NAD(P)-dependent oxidoreductase [Mucilaginibacter sp. L3T2-6]|uniref:NAD-dependent epimerase/dehydratase family protein n=1 Tax=Mucilaginibacter sp. L3T2-6 TaxID=3062491 RepID=UPI0026765F1E|nr:NAD(P)-dependent oxidoreductase [Mucilaginibacter sp. L3T2-6]MDO3641089.1 NAD(P)-dependent oxidoreductase [Mucilaginibacter sp. L3T2-6]MDV6213435.1 NAD(P)-dependent oxidoreductase [Mucilaginibacter sp. L3T2-6]
MKERVLITGASGFVGYHLIKEALANDLEVFAAIRKSSKIDHLKDFDIKYTYPDFGNLQALKDNMIENKYDYIIHAAGITRARSAKEYNQVNAGNSYNLALAALESNIGLKKFVLIGSLAAMGPLNTLDGIITGDTTPNPVTAYGKSKLLAEEKLKSLTALNYTILRPTGVYGPRDRDIFIFFKQVSNRIEPYIGHIEQKLSLIYVTDLAKVAIKALYAGRQKTYNLSDGNFYSRYALGDFAREALKLNTAKFHLPVNFVKFIARIAEKISSLNNKAAVLNVEKLNELMAVNWNCDITPAKADLGFSPAYDLKAGVTETIKWYKANNWL